jgi:hypothetical protein
LEQSTVAKYMAKKGDDPPAGQSWSTFLRNHMPHIAAIDLFVVPTIGFRLLYTLVIVRLARRELVWINVTAHPTAEWIAQQITEAFPWDEAPRYLIRDRDAVYGSVVTRRLRAMGIRDKPISAGSPWQNGFIAGPNSQHTGSGSLYTQAVLRMISSAEYSDNVSVLLARSRSHG